MSDSMIESLVATTGADAALQARCRQAANADELRDAISAAGFDPDHPDIAEALGLEAELDDQALEATAGGQGGIDGYQDPSAAMARPGIQVDADWK